MSQNNKIIAVYGSLRQGMGNHGLISHSKMIERRIVQLPYKMISLGWFPGLVKAETPNDIVIELYEVDQPTYARVERLEGYPNFYDKYSFELSDYESPVEIYVLNEKHGSYTQKGKNIEHIPDWVKYKTEN